MAGKEKKNTLTGLIFIVISSFVFAVVMGGNIFASELTTTPKKVDELIEPPPGQSASY